MRFRNILKCLQVWVGLDSLDMGHGMLLKPSSPAQHDSVINCRHAVISMIKCHIFPLLRKLNGVVQVLCKAFRRQTIKT